MMIVDLREASKFSQQTRRAWLPIAYGHRSPAMDERLGRPVVGHHLPGLGELAGWGLVDKDRGFSGGIYTGFFPDPTSVEFLLSARVVHGDRMSLESLDRLAELPAGILENLQIRSLLSRGPATRIQDRSRFVVDTLSRRALTICEELLAHLVSGSAVQVTRVDACNHPSVLVAVEDDRVIDLREIDKSKASGEPGWIEVVDWDDGLL
jgi:hypothetical protein